MIFLKSFNNSVGPACQLMPNVSPPPVWIDYAQEQKMSEISDSFKQISAKIDKLSSLLEQLTKTLDGLINERT